MFNKYVPCSPDFTTNSETKNPKFSFEFQFFSALTVFDNCIHRNFLCNQELELGFIFRKLNTNHYAKEKKPWGSFMICLLKSTANPAQIDTSYIRCVLNSNQRRISKLSSNLLCLRYKVLHSLLLETKLDCILSTVQIFFLNIR